MMEVKRYKLFPRGICYKGGKCDVLFFGESPGREEFYADTAFVGPSGKHLEKIIEGLLPKTSCVLDNVCPHWMDGDKPGKKELDEYADYRKKAIERFQPKVIVALGAIAIKALGLKASPTKHCGGVFKAGETCGSLPVVVSIHPAYVLRDPSQIGLWERVFAGIRSCLRPASHGHGGGDVRRVDLPAELQKWLKRRAKMLCSFDLETSALEPAQGHVLCCAICDGKETVWVPVVHKDFDWNTATRLWKEIVLWWEQGPRIVHHMKFELAWMRCKVKDFWDAFEPVHPDPPILYDTMLQAWLLDENQPKGLDHLVTSELGHPPYWLDLPSEGSLAEVPLETLGQYNALDAKYTYELFKLQRSKMGKEQIKLADDLLSPLAALLVRMEERGVHCDLKRLRAITTRMRGLATRRLRTMERAFPDVKFSSPQQLRKLIFGKLGLKPISWTDGGVKGMRQPSVKGDVLIKLAKQEPRLGKLAEARKIKSLVHRVLEPWQEAIDEQGFIHTEFGLGNVVTGRLSSSGPNIQNIDRRSKEISWKGIQREALTSRFKGGSLVQLDYKQGEYRIQAAVAGCRKILDVIRSGADPHQITADDLTASGIPCDRDRAKNVNFSVIYLITEYGLQERYGIPPEQGKKMISMWYELYPEVREYQERCFESVRKNGYVESIFGWRRHLSDMENDHERSQAVNVGIQNALVFICYLGMLAVEEMLRESKYKSLLISQEHDKIILDCPKNEVKKVSAKAKALMEGIDLKPWVGNRLRSPIPLAVDVKTGEHF